MTGTVTASSSEEPEGQKIVLENIVLVCQKCGEQEEIPEKLETNWLHCPHCGGGNFSVRSRIPKQILSQFGKKEGSIKP